MGPNHLYLYTNYIQNRYKGRDAGRDLRLHQLIKAYYYASISFVDYQIGRILDTLETLEKLENTLIIFASDHGEFLGDYNCFGKRSFLDSAARIPLICRLPERFQPGAACHTPASLVDILPTVAAATTSETSATDGIDLTLLANGNLEREAVFGHYQGHQGGIYMATTKDWKYIWSAADQKELLFDRSKDAQETRNRANNVANRANVRLMRHLLQSHIRDLPGHEKIVDANGWISKSPISLADDPDAGLIIQDPPCFLDRLYIPGYSDAPFEPDKNGGVDFDPLNC